MNNMMNDTELSKKNALRKYPNTLINKYLVITPPVEW